MGELLTDQGRLTGLLFASEFEKPGPPFGGTKMEYISIFEPYLEVEYMAIAANSIPPRQGNELLFSAIAKNQ
jgi:thiopurine S-methyltransferase